jgi:hypothetical protein
MSPPSSENGVAERTKAWLDLVVPILVGGGVIGNLVYDAIPLAPGLRALATFIAIPFCIFGFLWARGGARRGRYSAGGWVWLIAFLLAILGYKLLLGYFRMSPPQGWAGNIVADVVQVSVYGLIFAALTVALTLACRSHDRASGPPDPAD